MYTIYLFYFNIDLYKKLYISKIEYGLIIVYILYEKLQNK